MKNQMYTKPEGSLISFMSNKVKQNGGINLAQGIPGFSPPEKLLTQLKSICVEAHHQYAPGNGDLELLEQIKTYHKNDLNLTNENLMIVQGATEALSLLFLYIYKKHPAGFSCMAIDPVYESYKHLPNIYEIPFLPYQLKEERLNLEEIEKTILNNNVKLFFIASPGNPYGKIICKEDMDLLISLAKKHRFYILFDAVYKELYFDKKVDFPLMNLDPYVFYINSFSKMFSISGWRIGYFIAHECHMNSIRAIHDYTGLCTASILQKALAVYLKENNWGKDYSEELRLKLNSNFEFASTHLLNAGFEIPPTHGGYFIWAKLPEKFKDGYKFAIDLYNREKVAVIPGVHFSDSAEKYIRINIARNKEELSFGIKKIISFCNS